MIIINSYYLNTMNSKCQCHRDSVTQLEVLESTRLALVQSPLSRQCHRTVTDSRSRRHRHGTLLNLKILVGVLVSDDNVSLAESESSEPRHGTSSYGTNLN